MGDLQVIPWSSSISSERTYIWDMRLPSRLLNLRFTPKPFLGMALALILGQAVQTSAKPAFRELLYNPRWYRTFDSASSIIPAEGTLLFAWSFADAAEKPDSFFVGIDTLWGLPQDVRGNPDWDWDLQVCPDEICMNGLKAGIHGANAPYPFGDTGFSSEHHFQFFPAADGNYDFISPAKAIYGGLMFCRSRSTGVSDTVFAFGAWNLEWDPAFAPPVRPVNGYLPRLSDFAVSGDTVRYLKAGAGIAGKPARYPGEKPLLRVHAESRGLRITFPSIKSEKSVSILGLDGRPIWDSGPLAATVREAVWSASASSGRPLPPGFVLIRVSWAGGETWAKAMVSASVLPVP
ncbi:MAG: hypothetical protein JWP91_2174 [Fibrobacteres bacterium]|nr:hypothetical protein [Fibrobacterota bacterium]